MFISQQRTPLSMDGQALLAAINSSLGNSLRQGIEGVRTEVVSVAADVRSVYSEIDMVVTKTDDLTRRVEALERGGGGSASSTFGDTGGVGTARNPYKAKPPD